MRIAVRFHEHLKPAVTDFLFGPDHVRTEGADHPVGDLRIGGDMSQKTDHLPGADNPDRALGSFEFTAGDHVDYRADNLKRDANSGCVIVRPDLVKVLNQPDFLLRLDSSGDYPGCHGQVTVIKLGLDPGESLDFTLLCQQAAQPVAIGRSYRERQNIFLVLGKEEGVVPAHQMHIFLAYTDIRPVG